MENRNRQTEDVGGSGGLGSYVLFLSLIIGITVKLTWSIIK